MTRRLRQNGPVELYREFHGRNPRALIPSSIYMPKQLIHLGRAVAVIYESNKWNGGGDGKMAEYIHEFETPVGLFMDERAKKQLYLIGNAITVTEAGIEN